MDNAGLTQRMRDAARNLLEKGEVRYVIGWEKGTLGHLSPPAFLTRPVEAGRLVWDEFCFFNPATYLQRFTGRDVKVAVFVKGCDSRAINRLVQDRQVNREQVYALGVPCRGLVDEPPSGVGIASGKAGPLEAPLAAKCRNCRYHIPVVCDEYLGDDQDRRAAEAADAAASEAGAGECFAEVGTVQSLSLADRGVYWQKQYERCLRCYACRNVCPACDCPVCCFDDARTVWLSKRLSAGGNQFYGLTRAFHVAGRCIECGECERVCPVHLPIMQINKKIIQDINRLFGEYEAGIDATDIPPLGIYRSEDPDP